MIGFTRWPEQPYEDIAIDPLTGDLIKDAGGNPVFGSKMYLRGIVGGPNINLTESLDMSGALLKYRKDTRSTKSNIVDIQFVGPHEHYDQELEGGAGSTHGSPADYVDHCHVSDHYTIGMWRFQRNYNTLQSNIAVLPGRPQPQVAVNSIGLLASGTTIDGKLFCSEKGVGCPPVENATQVNLEAWIKHLLPPRGVQRQGVPDPRLDDLVGTDGRTFPLGVLESDIDAEMRNPAFDPFDADRDGHAQDPDGDNTCTGSVAGDTVAALEALSQAGGKCADGGDPEDWLINPPCPSLDGTFDAARSLVL